MPLAVAFNTEPTVACDDPTIYIAGDSGKIYYDNGTKYFTIDDMFALIGLDSENETDDEEEGDGENAVLEAAINILIPFILEGIASGKWDNYYAAVEKEIGEIFEPIKLDENGNTYFDVKPERFYDFAISLAEESTTVVRLLPQASYLYFTTGSPLLSSSSTIFDCASLR